MKSIIIKEYSEIKSAYIDVTCFLEKNGLTVISLDDKIAEDYHHWGDDNELLLSNFVAEFGLNYSTFIYSEYFESEGELFNIFSSFLTIMFLPYWLLVSLINSLPNVQIPLFPNKSINPRKDLTVGDLIAWRLIGSFTLRDQMKLTISPHR